MLWQTNLYLVLTLQGRQRGREPPQLAYIRYHLPCYGIVLDRPTAIECSGHSRGTLWEIIHRLPFPCLCEQCILQLELRWSYIPLWPLGKWPSILQPCLVLHQVRHKKSTEFDRFRSRQCHRNEPRWFFVAMSSQKKRMMWKNCF